MIGKGAVLVTGGAGYIGAHTCKALSRAGYRPVVFDSLVTGRRDFAKWGEFVLGDIRDFNAVKCALVAHKCEAVIHFAGLSSVSESMSKEATYRDVNVGGISTVLSAMREVGCRVLVFSSSAAVYGEPEHIPIPETAAVRPVNVYGQTKAEAERLIQWTCNEKIISAVSLRYFNAAGADPDKEIGEHRTIETHLIPRALMACLGVLDEFAVFGNDYPTPDGTAIRDYVHVSDLADAHLLALQYVLEAQRYDVFNIGTGYGHSVAQVLEMVQRVTGRKPETVINPRRAGDPAMLVASPRRARAQLGIVTAESKLSTIVRSAWLWHQVAYQ